MDDRDLKTHPLETVVADNLRLKEENARLRQLLAEKGITIPAPPKKDLSLATGRDGHDAGVNEHSSKDVKVGVFRGLFRGREDVYAVRMRFKSGDWGYVPASIRDWKAVLSADAAVRKKVDQKTRKLLSLTDDVLRQHLEGKQTIGVYPLLLDENCWFLAVDFDKKSWQENAAAFLETCHGLSVPAALERSRSGNGGHVWIFFARSFPAATVRKLGSLILTRTMDRRHQIGMDSYDRSSRIRTRCQRAVSARCSRNTRR
jgi:hypothetical protein